MKLLENCFSAFLSCQNLGDCSLCDIPMEINLEKKTKEFQKSKPKKQLIQKNLLKKAGIYLAMPMTAAYILLMQLIGD